jgi:hypothetical protein
MESLVLRGVNASGRWDGRPGLNMNVQNIIFDVPVSGTLTLASVTISGALTGAYTFNDSVPVNISFKSNEDVYITTSNFLSNYGVIINYVTSGDMGSYMTTDRTRTGIFAYETPWRFR